MKVAVRFDRSREDPGPPARPSPHTGAEFGFTILEIIIVLFLLTGLLSFIIPRLSIGDTLSSVGRKWIAALRTFQDMAISAQRPVRLYIDLDRGQYWPMIQQATEEKAPLDPAWITPVNLPETIHLTDLQVGSKKSTSGRAELFFYPNGKIDPAVMHFVDADQHVLGVQIEPVTGNITLADQRIEPPIPWTLPERLRPLLQVQPTLPTLKPTIPFGQS